MAVEEVMMKKKYGNLRKPQMNGKKKIWKLENTSNQWKKSNLADIQSRLDGWQLESFKDSYNHKIKNGISLYKKNLIK